MLPCQSSPINSTATYYSPKAIPTNDKFLFISHPVFKLITSSQNMPLDFQMPLPLVSSKLISHPGCNINQLSDDYCTPLYYAVLGNHANIVAELIQAKATVNDPDCEGTTPLHGAAQFGLLWGLQFSSTIVKNKHVMLIFVLSSDRLWRCWSRLEPTKRPRIALIEPLRIWRRRWRKNGPWNIFEACISFRLSPWKGNKNVYFP